MASVIRVRACNPRVFRLENVRDCPMGSVLEFLRKVFPQYEIEVFQADAADFDCCSERFRQWIIVALRVCLKAPFEVWTDLLRSMRTP